MLQPLPSAVRAATANDHDDVIMEYVVNASSSLVNGSDVDAHMNPNSLLWMATVPLVLLLLSGVTVIGNSMVIAAFVKDRRIRDKVHSVIILNLSITDLLVGVFILPINTVYISLGRWPFGEVACKMWLTMDYTLCLMSIFTIVLISLDRYWLVTKELRYASFQTRMRVVYTLACAWCACIILFVVLAFGWAAIAGEESTVNYTTDCEMEFARSLPTTLAVNITEFIIPLATIVYLNIVVYYKIRKGPEGMVHRRMPSLKGKSQFVAVSSFRSPKHTCKTRAPLATKQVTFPSHHHVAPEIRDQEQCIMEAVTDPSDSTQDTDTSTAYAPYMTVKRHAQHRKAAFMLAVIVGVFLFCWLPYQFTSIRMAVCGDCVHALVWEITNCLLWCNSTINPFLYAMTNLRFRRNFNQFFCQWQHACFRRRCALTHEVTESEI